MEKIEKLYEICKNWEKIMESHKNIEEIMGNKDGTTYYNGACWMCNIIMRTIDKKDQTSK